MAHIFSLTAAKLFMLFIFLSFTAQAQVADFNATVEAARGQTVYFNAWGGDDKINDYIEWAGDALQSHHGITVAHVKLADKAAAVHLVLTEKNAGRYSGGAADLLGVNDEKYSQKKRNDELRAVGRDESPPSSPYT